MRAGLVIEGQYKGQDIHVGKSKSVLVGDTDVTADITGYQVVSDEFKWGQGAAAAVVGVLVAGPVGLVAGALGARKRHRAVVTWRDHSESLIEVSSMKLHKLLGVVAEFNDS